MSVLRGVAGPIQEATSLHNDRWMAKAARDHLVEIRDYIDRYLRSERAPSRD